MRPRTIPVLACALALVAATPAAAERLPISSRDDQADSLSNRIYAVAEVVRTMDARMQRIEASVPPSPVLPPSPVYPALASVQDAAAGLLASSGRIVCATEEAASATGGGDTIADDDTRAEDTSSDGIVGQLDAVATVLGQADARLIRVGELVGAGSGSSEIEAAGAVWAGTAALFNRTVDLLANTDHVPPSPVCPVG
jgi:hypothetical protein